MTCRTLAGKRHVSQWKLEFRMRNRAKRYFLKYRFYEHEYMYTYYQYNLVDHALSAVQTFLTPKNVPLTAKLPPPE